MSSKLANSCVAVGGIASLVIILGFFGIDAEYIKTEVQGMTLRLVLLIVSLLVLGTGLYLRQKRAKITPENIEPKIREWLDTFALSVRKIPAPTSYFAFEVSLPTGVPIAIVRARDLAQYLTLVSNIEMSPQHKASLAELPEPEKTRFFQEMALEAAKSRIAFTPDETFSRAMITKRIPITPSLTEAHLMESVGEINFAAIIMLNAIVLGIERRTKKD